MNRLREKIFDVLRSIAKDNPNPVSVPEIVKRAVASSDEKTLKEAAAGKFSQLARSMLRGDSLTKQLRLELGDEPYYPLTEKGDEYVRRANLSRDVWALNVLRLSDQTAVNLRRLDRAKALYLWGVAERGFHPDPKLEAELKRRGVVSSPRRSDMTWTQP